MRKIMLLVLVLALLTFASLTCIAAAMHYANWLNTNVEAQCTEEVLNVRENKYVKFWLTEVGFKGMECDEHDGNS